MSIKHRLSTTAMPFSSKPPLSKQLLKVPLIVIALLIAMIFSVISLPSALAAEASILGVGGSKTEEAADTSIPDSFGRDTPRHTVQGFLGALGENDYLLASN